MKTIDGIDRLVLRGGTVELSPAADLSNAVKFDEMKAAEVDHQAENRTLVLQDYFGKLWLPDKSTIRVVIEGANVSGEISSGEIMVADVTLTVKPPPSARRLAPRTRMEHVLWILKDVVGISGATVIFVMIFTLLGMDWQERIVWEIVLGAGAYFGFSGRWAVAVIVAIGAIIIDTVNNFPDGQASAFGWALAKLALFLGIMGVGKRIRDYLDQYIRSGYTGMKNKYSRR